MPYNKIELKVGAYFHIIFKAKVLSCRIFVQIYVTLLCLDAFRLL